MLLSQQRPPPSLPLPSLHPPTLPPPPLPLSSAGWLGLGAFLLEAGLGEEEEAALDFRPWAALQASRVLHARATADPAVSATYSATSTVSTVEEAAISTVSDVAVVSDGLAESSPWFGFGLELLEAGLDGEWEAALDSQSAAALRAARCIVTRAKSARGGEVEDAGKSIGGGLERGNWKRGWVGGGG